MRSQPGLLVIFLTVFAVLAPATAFSAAQASGSGKNTQTGKKQAASGSSLSGCVDEKEGHYIMVDDRDLTPVADLEADGFPTEGFAKHVGHRVTVRGTSSSGSTRPVFKVRSIETVSETCAPTPQSDKK
jgi:3-oxoacyl-(acyl-carrier-protein) synthase